MGWSLGFDSNWNRDIGYGVPAYCDYPGCSEEIDRGLSYVCGGEPYGGEEGCGLYFCSNHLFGMSLSQRCERCNNDKDVFDPFPLSKEHPDWLKWKLEDESWKLWREENPELVNKYKELLKGE